MAFVEPVGTDVVGHCSYDDVHDKGVVVCIPRYYLNYGSWEQSW